MTERTISPDCRDENCQKCYGQGICLATDSVVPCECVCHIEGILSSTA